MDELHHLWASDAAQPVSSILLTVGAFLLAERIARAANGAPLFNPVLISVLIVACVLELTGTEYAAYAKDASFISFLVGPGTVALGLPLWRQWPSIRGHLPEIAATLAAGLLLAPTSALAIASVLGATPDVMLSLAPKSVTTAIALGISQQIGAIPGLTAVVVISTGISGAILSARLFAIVGVRDWAARGLATGIASHAIGTAAILRRNEMAGAMAGLAIGLNGLLSAALLPAVLVVLRHWL